jgi:hypothetical protein
MRSARAGHTLIRDDCSNMQAHARQMHAHGGCEVDFELNVPAESTMFSGLDHAGHSAMTARDSSLAARRTSRPARRAAALAVRATRSAGAASTTGSERVTAMAGAKAKNLLWSRLEASGG